jgi:hypothetical protein
MMRAFDMPTPFTTIGRRNVSNVPAQALILMNDPFVSQQAALWAKNLLADSALSPESRINSMYQAAFARPATAAETKQTIAFLKIQSQTLKLKPDAWKTHPQVWGDVCHVMFNLKEFVFLR